MPYTSILIVEDGTVVEDANSYTSIAFADAYHALYSNSDWTGDQATKETALVIACQTLDLLYGSKFKSFKIDAASTGQTQSLLWPRYAFYDQYANYRAQADIPVELQKAQAELAMMYMQGVDMNPPKNREVSLSEEMIKVGELQTSVKYRSPLESETYTGYNKIDNLLFPLLKPKVTQIRLSR